MSENGNDGMSTGLAWFFGIGIGFCVLVLMVSAYTIGVNVGEDRAGDGSAPAENAEPAPEPQKEAASAGPGRELFVSSCGSCHTLAAAGTTGTTGPDLDTLGPDDAQVLAAIENGGAGSGAMPAGILEGKEAEEVAAYVSASAGR